jgi:hypothetical protein
LAFFHKKRGSSHRPEGPNRAVNTTRKQDF